MHIRWRVPVITTGAYFEALKAFQLSTDGAVVRIKHLVPLPVAQLCKTFC